MVYKTAVYDAQLVEEWCPDANRAQVPPTIVDSVVSVPVGEDGPGRVVASGPGDATAGGAQEKEDAEVEAAKQAQIINAFSEDGIPGSSDPAAMNCGRPSLFHGMSRRGRANAVLGGVPPTAASHHKGRAPP